MKTTGAQLKAAGFTLRQVDGEGSSTRERWDHPTGLLAHRYAIDDVTFGYLLDGADKVDADEELADYLERHPVVNK